MSNYTQALWTDKHVAGFMLVALLVGILIGWAL